MTDSKKQAESDFVAKTARERTDVLRGLALGIFRGLHEEAALIAGAEALEAQARPSPKVLTSGWGVLVAPDELLVASEPDVGSGPVIFESEGEALNEARLRPEPCRVVQVQVVEVTK